MTEKKIGLFHGALDDGAPIADFLRIILKNYSTAEIAILLSVVEWFGKNRDEFDKLNGMIDAGPHDDVHDLYGVDGYDWTNMTEEIGPRHLEDLLAWAAGPGLNFVSERDEIYTELRKTYDEWLAEFVRGTFGVIKVDLSALNWSGTFLRRLNE